MRKAAPTWILIATIAFVAVLVVITWRPWAEGAAGRATASGLIPVLTLLIGQLFSYAIATTSQSQALAVRRLELDREDARADAERKRAQAELEASARVQRAADSRRQILLAVEACSNLSIALSLVIRARFQTPMPSDELTRARIALLSIQHLFDPELPDDTFVTADLTDILNEMEEVNMASFTTLPAKSGDLMRSLQSFERRLARRGSLDPRVEL